MLCFAQHLHSSRSAFVVNLSDCLRLDLCCFGLVCLGLRVTLLILDLFRLSSFVLPNTSSRSARCRLVSVSIFAALVCSTPRVDLLVVELSRQSVSTFRALC